AVAQCRGEFHQLLVLLGEWKVAHIDISHRDIESDPVQIGGIELDPAVIAGIYIETVKRRLEQRPIDHAGRDAHGLSQGRKERMKIRAVASFCPQTVLRATYRGRLQVLGVLDPVIDVVQRPVIDLACRPYWVLFTSNDLVS